jgi:hypothetical protein
MLAKQLPSGARQEQSSSVKARDELVEVEARSRIKAKVRAAMNGLVIKAYLLNKSENKFQTGKPLFKKLRPPCPSHLLLAALRHWSLLIARGRSRA